jgi:hypothetical protein
MLVGFGGSVLIAKARRVGRTIVALEKDRIQSNKNKNNGF